MASSTELPSSVSNASATCDITTNEIQIYWIGINIPIAVILLLMATLCRCQFNPFKCCGRLKLVYPMNFLDGYSNRLPYVFAFLVTSNVIIDLLQLGSDGQEYLAQYSPTVRFFLWATIKYVCIIFAGLVFYPLLACITYSTFLTDVMGLMFTCNWFVMYIYIYTLCPIGSDSPLENDNELKLTHYQERVKHLLEPVDTWKRNVEPNRKFKKLLRHIYPAFPGFRYSTRIVCTVGLSLIVLYQTSIVYIANILTLVQETVGAFIVTDPESKLFDIIELSFNLSSYPAMCISFLNCLFFLRNYRENTRELWKGDRISYKPIQPHSIVISCLSFSSLSVAYTFWGFLVLQIILWIIMFGIVVIIRFNLLLGLLEGYWTYLFGIVLFVVMQQLLARFVLLHRNTNGALVINNRHLFHIIVHFFFFLNIIVGLVGSLLRIIKVAVVGILLIGRVDLCLAPRGFEWADKGFGAYRSFLELEVSLTHPVVVTFCKLLNQSRRKRVGGGDDDVERQSGEGPVDGDIAFKDVAASWGTKDKTFLSRRVRNRWFKTLTMIRNKRLVYERLHKLEEIRDETWNMHPTKPQQI